MSLNATASRNISIHKKKNADFASYPFLFLSRRNLKSSYLQKSYGPPLVHKSNPIRTYYAEPVTRLPNKAKRQLFVYSVYTCPRDACVHLLFFFFALFAVFPFLAPSVAIQWNREKGRRHFSRLSFNYATGDAMPLLLIPTLVTLCFLFSRTRVNR